MTMMACHSKHWILLLVIRISLVIQLVLGFAPPQQPTSIQNPVQKQKILSCNQPTLHSGIRTNVCFPLPKTTLVLKAQSQQDDNSNNDNNNANDETVPVGSEEYYKGFLSRTLEEEPVERVTGDAVLGPTLKFVGGFAVVLSGLLLAFLASNGLL